MLDTNNVTLSSLLSLNLQDNTGTDGLTALNEEQKQDEDSALDPNTFVLLFAQIAANIPVPEQQDARETAAANLIDAESVTIEKPQNKPIMAALEDNVAVAWINSDYYQSEINADLTEVSQVLSDASDTKQTALAQDNEQNSVLNNSINWEWLETPLPLIPSLSENVGTTAPINQTDYRKQVQQTNVPFNLIELNNVIHANQDPRYAEQTSGLIDIQSSIDASNFVNEPELLENKEQNNIFVQSVSSEIKNNELMLEDDLIGEEELLDIETSVPGKSKSSLFSEMQTRTPIIDTVKNVPTPTLDGTAFNQVSNNSLQLFSDRHENGNSQLNLPQSFTIPTDIEHPEWSKQFSDHVMWLGQQGIKSAVIKLHPEDLGPLEISIRVVNDSASVNIASHSQQVRDLIDQSLPKLQEMMAEQGLNLSEVNIDADTKERQFGRHENNFSTDLVPNPEEDIILTPIKNKVVSQGIIDYFA